MATEEVFVWDKEIPVPASLISYVDDAIVSKFPKGTRTLGIFLSGASYWARTAKIDAVDAHGENTPFFIKVHRGDHGENMVSSEFTAMTELYKAAPEMVAEPVGWGRYQEDPQAWFFVCRYHELSGDIPDLSDFPALIAEMHKRVRSPDGKFGFPHVVFGGRNPQYFPPSDSWEETFSAGLSAVFDLEEGTHGPDQEMRELRQGILELVIPRLLRPLESEGRKLVPRLCHGDLWDGNASVDVNTGQPIIFDATPMYAHNEYEMGPWWPPRHKMTQDYIQEYTNHFPMSEPLEDFKDRGALYCLRFDLHAASLYTGNHIIRNIARETMRDLVKKYPLGYPGYEKERAMT